MKKKLVSIGLFILIFGSLLVIASLYDYQISVLLAKKGLEGREYYSSNFFGQLIKILGEMPLYIFLSFAGAIFIGNVYRINRKWLQILVVVLSLILGVVAGYIGCNKICKYSSQVNPTLEIFYKGKVMPVVWIIISMMVNTVFLYFISYKYKKLSVKLLPIALIIVIAAALGQGVVHALKPIFARERFRASHYFEYHKIISEGYNPWYVIKGSSSTLAKQYGVGKTYFSSFPSGHTACAGIVYCLMYIPFFVKSLDNKKYKWIFIVAPILITGIVALGRIVVGAHYLSDVLVGGTLAYLASVVAFLIVKKIIPLKE